MPLLPEEIRTYARSFFQRIEDCGATLADAIKAANILDEMIRARAVQAAERSPHEVPLAIPYEERLALRARIVAELRERVDAFEAAGMLDGACALHLRISLDRGLSFVQSYSTAELASAPTPPAAPEPQPRLEAVAQYIDEDMPF